MRPVVDGELADLAVDRGLYDAAVSHGIDVTRCSAEVERAERPVRLLATATVHTPTLLVALATRSAAARSLSAGLVRIAHHALAVHARDNDYDPEPWIAQAITIARLHVQEEEFDEPRLVDRLEAAAEQLCEAIVALASDRMGFPDHLTQAQAAWLTCFRHAS